MKEAEEAAVIDVWLENKTAVKVFSDCLSQWRSGFSGAYALDYNVFPIVARDEYNSPEWPDTLLCIQVMEEATLKYWAYMRDKR